MAIRTMEVKVMLMITLLAQIMNNNDEDLDDLEDNDED